MEEVDEEREERLEIMKKRVLEWKGMVDAVMESEWRQLSCRNIVMEVVEVAVIASRWRLCRQVMEELETLEVSRIVKEVEDGGMERM